MKEKEKKKEEEGKRNATQLSATNNFTPHATRGVYRASPIRDPQIQHQQQLDCRSSSLSLSLPPSLNDRTAIHCNGQRFVAVAGPCGHTRQLAIAQR